MTIATTTITTIVGTATIVTIATGTVTTEGTAIDRRTGGSIGGGSDARLRQKEGPLKSGPSLGQGGNPRPPSITLHQR